MAWVYVDNDLATGLNDGTSWANAYQSLAAYITAGPVAGDQVAVRGGVAAETLAASAAYTIDFSAGTSENPIEVYAVKNATTNAPPQPSDLVTDRNHADCPLWQVTGATSGTVLNVVGEYFTIYGALLRSGRYLRFSTTAALGDMGQLEECELWYGKEVNTGALQSYKAGSNNSYGVVRTVNCRVKTGDAAITGSEIEFSNAKFVMDGGEFVDARGVAFTLFGAFYGRGEFEFNGVDIQSSAALNLINLADGELGISVKLNHCKVPAGLAYTTGTAATEDQHYHVELVHCNSNSDHTAAIPDYVKVTHEGTVESETTIVRTGGGSDGDNGLAFKMTPRSATSTVKGLRALQTPWIALKLDGTETSFSAYFMRQLAADTLNKAEVWIEYLTPNEGVGSAGANYRHHYDKEYNIGGTRTNWTSGDTSTWGGGGSQTKWKISRTISPEYPGYGFFRVCYAPESTQPLFVDNFAEAA